jgi:hypothetical protein
LSIVEEDTYAALVFFCCRFAKYVDLEKTVLGADQDELIEKVLTNQKTKRKHSTDDETESLSELTPTEKPADPPTLDENDIKWAANYIEEQQTQLILSILTDDGEKPSDPQEDSEHEVDEEYKSPRPTLATLGIREFFLIEDLR